MFPAAVSVTYWSVSFLNCSIFRIHNHSCMNVQFCFSQQTNHLLRPRMLTLFFVHWLICLLSLHSSFISNLKANISSLNITLLPHILSLSLSLFTLCPPPSLSLAIISRNHLSMQWGNNRSSLSLGRSDCCTFHYNWDMTDCLGDGRWGIWMNRS